MSQEVALASHMPSGLAAGATKGVRTPKGTGEGALVSKLICRVRPCDRPSPVVSVSEEEARVEVSPEKGQIGEPLLFHHVLHNSSGHGEQEALFNVVRPAIAACMRRRSSTILAYGGPQSGKTYALSGFFHHARLNGLIPRSIELIKETLEKDIRNAPIVETSFFELGQEAVFDLVPASLPKVDIQELMQPPYVAIDDTLTVQRCDGERLYNRLFDTYLVGLDHRRKGAHTCYQISFTFEDGVRSYLRFIDMAWPRSQMPSAGAQGPTPSMPTMTKASTSLAAAIGGKAASVLDQVLQCKLTDTGTPPYRASPLVMLLKPCFEGDNLLNFVYCLRLEHSQIASLGVASPLLTKLYFWFNRISGHKDFSGLAARSLPPSLIPPLQLQAQDDSQAFTKTKAAGLNGSLANSSCGDSEETSELANHHALSHADADTAAGSTETLPEALPIKTQQNRSMVKDLEDFKIVEDCRALLEVKQRAVEILKSDVERSVLVYDNLRNDLQHLRLKREASGDGPCEKETNLKWLCEKVSRSLNRTADMIKKIYEDMEGIGRFCDVGVIPTVYDSYNVTEENVQQILEHMAKGSSAPSAQTAPPPREVEHTIVIPALPLSQLPQEKVEMSTLFAQCNANQLSPSSASSSEFDMSASMVERGMLAGSPPIAMRSLGYSASLMSLPSTPPMPAAPQRKVTALQGGLSSVPGMIAPPIRAVSPQGSSFTQVDADLNAAYTPGYGGLMLRKSQSTRAMSTMAQVKGVEQRAPPPVTSEGPLLAPTCGSPMLGHRASLQGISPLRGSAAAASALGHSLSMSALPGNASPLMLPKRSVLASCNARAGPPRPNGQPETKATEVRSRGSTSGGHTQAQSPSPMMLRRSVSSQVGGLRGSHHAPCGSGPSPQRQRPGGPGLAGGISPMRAAVPSASPANFKHRQVRQDQ